MSTPKLDDLENASGISSTTWHRHLKDPAFAMALKQAIHKKFNYAKTKNSKTFWDLAESGVDEVINKIHSKIKASRSENFDPAGYPSVPDDIDPDLGDAMKDDIGRNNYGSSFVDDNG